MWEGGVTPNLVTFNSLVNGLCKPGRMQDARKVFDEIVREGLEMIQKRVLTDVVTFTSLIHAMCRANLGRAMALMKQMREGGIRMNETALIDGFCKKGFLDDALLIMKEMRGCGEKALSLHDEMIKIGVLPDVVTYNVLINGLNNQHFYHEDPVPANIKYDALMHCCRKAEFKSVLGLLEGFCMEGLMDEADTLDGSVYSALIHALCRGGNVMKALSFHKQTFQRGFAPNPTTTISLTRGLFEKGMIVEAGQVTQQFLNCCSLAAVEASKSLIDLNLKEDVLHNMARDGLLPSSRRG
uniref:Pentacotripeptide-repeat region of PRORP domain-containing protein n=1 Tax=Setaria viridis TaxID=4556 RepID=A0A4U6UWJ1_SETVI|nr:hypothetical protein SEVIR_4G069100v2 [Setaria viridis]